MTESMRVPCFRSVEVADMAVKWVKAASIRVTPCRVNGYESHGHTFLVDEHSDVAGGQCANCNTIIWENVFANPVLSERRPDGVPPSGPDYRKYHVAKRLRFLSALPRCPNCGSSEHDLFVNNMVIPRFPDGVTVVSPEEAKTVRMDPESVNVWLNVVETQESA